MYVVKPSITGVIVLGDLTLSWSFGVSKLSIWGLGFVVPS